MAKILGEFNILDNKTIKIINGDMTESNEEYDIVFCSAFKGDYTPIPRTLIYALLRNKKINVEKLSENKEIDLSQFGGWLSKEIDNSNFKRLGCIEILSFQEFVQSLYGEKILKIDRILSQSFMTLSYLVQQASFSNIPVKKIALPILGAGNQEIELEYIIPPLLAQSLSLLKTIETLEEITFYELNEEVANKLVSCITSTLNVTEKPDVFISYSTKNQSMADEIASILRDNNIKFWMAPNSIPSTSNYLKEISKAIANVSILLLVLTKDAEDSPWVPSEVASAKGARKILFAVKPYDYKIGDTFSLLMQTSQIHSLYDDVNYKESIVRIINAELNKLSC